MGVLACDREECENVMCDICVAHRYYVCWECAQEFEAEMHGQQLTEDEFLEKLREFMSKPRRLPTPEPPPPAGIMSAAEFLDKWKRRY